MLIDEIKVANTKIARFIAERDALLADLRRQCKHLKLVEIEYMPMEFIGSIPPRRICVDCGAEEAGWGVGYRVLAVDNDNVSSAKRRVIIRKTSSRDIFYRYRQPGPLHFVGQSHPDFAKRRGQVEVRV